MRSKRVLTSLGAMALAVLAPIGCMQGSTEMERTATTIVLPVGDPEAGRLVFASLGCALCHGAAGDRGIPEPVSTTLGPILGPEQAGQTTAMLVDSILNPSHRLPESMAGESVSPMPDFSGITVRQLSDVVTYIRYLGE